MAKTIFDRETRQELMQRLSALTPASRRRFGKMTVGQMVCHLVDSLQVELGQKPAAYKPSPLALPPLRRLAIYIVPWPKGKAKTAPEMLVTQPGELAADVERLKGLLDEAVARGASGNWATHPAFGKLSGKDYGVLIYKHFNHHLEQFGV